MEINGTNFVSGATVSFGGVPATGVNVASSTAITATTPANPAGAVDVTVTNPDSQFGTLFDGFTYVPAPTIESVFPAEGPGGTLVVIG